MLTVLISLAIARVLLHRAALLGWHICSQSCVDFDNCIERRCAVTESLDIAKMRYAMDNIELGGDGGHEVSGISSHLCPGSLSINPRLLFKTLSVVNSLPSCIFHNDSGCRNFHQYRLGRPVDSYFSISPILSQLPSSRLPGADPCWSHGPVALPGCLSWPA